MRVLLVFPLPAVFLALRFDQNRLANAFVFRVLLLLRYAALTRGNNVVIIIVVVNVVVVLPENVLLEILGMRCIRSNIVVVVVVDGGFQVEAMLLMRLSLDVMRMMRVVRVMSVLMLTQLEEVLRPLDRRRFEVVVVDE